MKPDRNLRNSLFDSGILDTASKTELEAFKESHRKRYLSEYNAEYYKKKVRKTIILSYDEMEYLKKKAKDYQAKNLSDFMRSVLFAYLDQSYIFPQADQITRIEDLLIGIQNRITQTILYIDQAGRVGVADIEQVKQQIRSLEIHLEQVLKKPLPLHDFIAREVERDRHFLQRLMRIISQYLVVEPDDH